MKLRLIGLAAALLVIPAWGGAAAGAAAATGDAERVLVVVDRGVPAYREAADGLKRGMSEFAVAEETTPAGFGTAAVQTGGVRLVVAVGADARAAVARAKSKAPVISTMISMSDLGGEPLTKPAGSVYLDLDFGQIAQEVGRLFPDKKRLGLILASRKDGPNKAAASRLAQDGFQLTIAVSPNRAALVEAVRELKGKVDLVICLPETGLFDSRTIPLLLRVTLEDQLPVIGYSPSFVRAGAVAGVFPDYGDIGLQTAAMVKRALANPAPSDAGDETPRKVASVTNATVLRLLGWKLSQARP